MTKITVRFRETCTYAVEIEVPNKIAALPLRKLEEWLLGGEDDSNFFLLACEQKPDWASTCLEGGVDSRELVGVEGRWKAEEGG